MEPYILTQVYAIGDISPLQIPIDVRIREVTVTVDPLNIPNPPPVLTADLHNQSNFVSTGASGTISLGLEPPNSFTVYTTAESTIDLANPSFFTTPIQVQYIRPSFTLLAGCTHVAVSVIGQQY